MYYRAKLTSANKGKSIWFISLTQAWPKYRSVHKRYWLVITKGSFFAKHTSPKTNVPNPTLISQTQHVSL